MSDEVLDIEEQEEAPEGAALVEALVFTNGEPLEAARLKDILGLTKKELETCAEYLSSKYGGIDSGIEFIEVGGAYQFRSKGEYAEIVRELRSSKPRRLTPAALETLASSTNHSEPPLLKLYGPQR